MAGFSIVLLTLLFAWPVMLVVTVAYLAFELAAVVVTSPAFPFIVISVIACVWGMVETAVILWKRFRDPEAEPLTIKRFTRVFVLFAVSFVTICIAAVLAGVAIFGFLQQATS